MIQIEEAQDILVKHAKRITETEKVSIRDAEGRILAEDVVAAADQPPFPRSPLDGYAMKAADLENASKEKPAVLEVIGKIFAGYVFEGCVESGQAVRLMTGAPIPEGADTVVRQEDTEENEGKVSIFVSSKPYKNYCPKGEDYKAGDVLLKAGNVLNAGRIAVLSSLGKTETEVYRTPKVSVIATGDEVVAPGETLAAGKIYDSNLTYITMRLKELGMSPVISEHCTDEPEVMAERIKEAAEISDLIITTGGVSVGEKDIMHDVADILKAERLFWNVNIKPGKPTLAFVYNGVTVLCLSGNPYGAVVNFELLGRPILAALTGNPDLIMEKKKAVLNNGFAKSGGKRRFVRGDYKGGKVTVFEQPSGTISTMADCNCFIEFGPDTPEAAEGTEVEVYLL